MTRKEKIEGIVAIAVVVTIGIIIGFVFRGCSDTHRQIKFDKDKTEIRMRVDAVNEILSLVNDLIEVFEEYESEVNEILTYRDGELENRIRFRDNTPKLEVIE